MVGEGRGKRKEGKGGGGEERLQELGRERVAGVGEVLPPAPPQILAAQRSCSEMRFRLGSGDGGGGQPVLLSPLAPARYEAWLGLWSCSWNYVKCHLPDQNINKLKGWSFTGHDTRAGAGKYWSSHGPRFLRDEPPRQVV